MLDKLLARYRIEKSHFDELGDTAKLLFYSYTLFLLSYPMMGTFLNAYLWRQSSDISLIAIYNLGFFVALPIGFYLNGMLLRTISLLRLYWLGTILQGLAAFLTIFLPSANLNRIFVYGLMFGLGGGIYWANKNYLSLKITRGKNRNYYNNLEGSLDLIIGTIMPVLIGWFIVLGSYLDIYSIESAYKLLMLIAFGLLVISGHLMQSANIQHETIQNISLPKSTRIWNLSRLVQIIYWTLGGINFIIPTVLVLMFVGEEGILGTVESVVYLFSAVILYYLGRKTDSRHHITIVMVCAAIFLLAAILYNFTFGLVGALIYTMFCSLTSGPAWNAIYTTTMEVMDKEHGENPSVSQYGYVLDNEIFFNLGRLLGMVLFFGLAYITTQETSLRFTPIIAGSLQLLLIYPLSILVRYHRGK